MLKSNWDKPPFLQLIVNYGKCPDLLVDGIWYEHERFCGEKPKRSFRNMCNHGFQQSNRIIIEDCGLTKGYMLRSIGGQQKAGIKISELWIHRNGKYKLLYKTEGWYICTSPVFDESAESSVRIISWLRCKNTHFLISAQNFVIFLIIVASLRDADRDRTA